jgi:hypothetical protein
VPVWIDRDVIHAHQVRGAELDDVLPGEDEQLPVDDTAGGFLAHRDAGVAQRRDCLDAAFMRGFPAAIHDETDRHSSLMSFKELVDNPRIAHEPLGDVNAHGFIPNELNQRRPAVLEGRVAVLILRVRRGRQREGECEGKQQIHAGFSIHRKASCCSGSQQYRVR